MSSIESGAGIWPNYIKKELVGKNSYSVEAAERDAEVTATEKIKRFTYSQDWSAYDKAQTKEKELFMSLLSDLCQTIPDETRQISKGRPRLPIRDMAFSSALKVFTTFSLRRFMTDMRTANELGYLQTTPHFSMVSYYMEKPEFTPILKELITLSAMPLKSVETDFAIDSTGFRTTKFNDYCREKHNTGRKHTWVKAHICCGVKTNIVTAIEIGEELHSADSPQFIPLAKQTYDSGFKIREVSGDKAYTSKANYNAINELGGTAYIPFKSNTKIRGTSHSKGDVFANSHSKGSDSRIWRKMYRYFAYNQEEFLEHYHKRSNIESTNNMIKAKFTDLVRIKNKTAQVNEVLLKVLCHNICVLIQEMFELGIEPNFLEGA